MANPTCAQCHFCMCVLTSTEGYIVRLCYSGDAIKEDDIIAQIETDKVTIDVKYTASAPGTITQLMVKEGDTVVVGQDIAKVEEGVAEAKPAAPAAAAAPQPAAAAAPPPPPPPAPKPAAAPEVRNSTSTEHVVVLWHTLGLPGVACRLRALHAVPWHRWHTHRGPCRPPRAVHRHREPPLLRCA